MAHEVLHITPEHAYVTRREFLRRTGILAIGGLAVAACGGSVIGGTPGSGAGEGVAPGAAGTPGTGPGTLEALPTTSAPYAGAYAVDELGNPTTTLNFIQDYGYYYEFSRARMNLRDSVGDYQPPEVRLEVGGLVRSPMTLTVDDLRRLGEVTRINRHRCLECWSMVIPWEGVPLRNLLDVVEPLPEAKYVRFEGRHDPENMPGQRPGAYDDPAEEEAVSGMGGEVVNPYRWPYVEGLRLDEAMHDLTLLATGMYGRPLGPTNGAPLRLVVPWKYGFKSIKQVVKIELVASMPISFWMAAAPFEHGFYANVNPSVPHPRWEQVKEVRYRGICPESIVPSLMFNGYEDQVAHLYEGMDLERWF